MLGCTATHAESSAWEVRAIPGDRWMLLGSSQDVKDYAL